MFFFAVATAVIGWGAFFLGRALAKEEFVRLLPGKVDDEIARRQAEEKQRLLGPRGPQDGGTVVERLRQMGFEVLKYLAAPRPHMLGWVYVVPLPSLEARCPYCENQLNKLLEVQEVDDKTCSVEGAFLVAASQLGNVCNACGVFWNERFSSAKASGNDLSSRPGILGDLLAKANSCNLFDVLDYIQRSGPMGRKVSEYLEENRRLLDREAARISEAISRHQLTEWQDLSGQPYRTNALPEASEVPKSGAFKTNLRSEIRAILEDGKKKDEE